MFNLESSGRITLTYLLISLVSTFSVMPSLVQGSPWIPEMPKHMRHPYCSSSSCFIDSASFFSWQFALASVSTQAISSLIVVLISFAIRTLSSILMCAIRSAFISFTRSTFSVVAMTSPIISISKLLSFVAIFESISEWGNSDWMTIS